MTDPVDKTLGTITKDEPVVVAHAAALAVAWVGEFIVGRTHLLTASQWNANHSVEIFVMTAVLSAISATLIRRVVTPSAKLAKAAEAKAHEILDGYIAVGSHAVVPTDPAPAVTSTTDAVTAALAAPVS